MEEKSFQLDLLKAKYDKLSKNEHIYRIICESSDYGYIYQSLGTDELLCLGSFEIMFGRSVGKVRDIDDFLECFSADDRTVVWDTINAENTGKEFASCECRSNNERTWYRIYTRIEENREEDIIYRDKIVTFIDITKEKAYLLKKFVSDNNTLNIIDLLKIINIDHKK